MILAAGLGTRLAPFTHHHPKALAKVGGMTVLEWNIRYLQSFGIREVVVNVHHFADQIEAAVANASGWGAQVAISDERQAVLETGGGVLHAAHFFEPDPAFVVMNVDVLTNLDLGRLIRYHQEKAPLASLAVMQRNSSRYLLFNEHQELVGWKNDKTNELKGLSGTPAAFSGIQVLSRTFVEEIQRAGKFSLIDAYLDCAFSGGQILGFDHTGDIFTDIGKPESLLAAEKLFL